MVEMMPEHMGYDRAIVIFSPDGRLFQVEYAREAVKKGATAVGVVYKDGVILAAIKKASKLVKLGDKIFKLDDHIGTVTSGLVADARVLVDRARVKAQQNRIVYGEPISLYSMAKFLADTQQVYTQYAGVRPYGVSMLIGGVNKKPDLYETDPSGILIESLARGIGNGADKVNAFFEKEYKEGLLRVDALKLAINAIKKATKIVEDVDIAVIEEAVFQTLKKEDLKKLGIKL